MPEHGASIFWSRTESWFPECSGLRCQQTFNWSKILASDDTCCDTKFNFVEIGEVETWTCESFSMANYSLKNFALLCCSYWGFTDSSASLLLYCACLRSHVAFNQTPLANSVRIRSLSSTDHFVWHTTRGGRKMYCFPSFAAKRLVCAHWQRSCLDAVWQEPWNENESVRSD